MSEPSVIIAICGTLLVAISALAGGLLYVIRAEVRKGNVTTEQAHAEMIPNHGTSMRDAVDRIERRQGEYRDEARQSLDTVHARISSLHTDLRVGIQRLDRHIDSQHEHAN